MPISKRKLAANRANAQKSCGPVSAAGKAIVSQNRTQHGLCGRFQVMKGEDQQKFENLFDQLMRDEKPFDSAEVELVRKMAEYTWLSRRATKCQEACFQVCEPTSEQMANDQRVVHISHELDRYLRYQSHHDRAYQRAANELLRRRKERQLAARGFERQKREQAAEERREKAANQRDERYKTAVALDELKLEREIIRNQSLKSFAAGSQSASEPTGKGKIAAQTPSNAFTSRRLPPAVYLPLARATTLGRWLIRLRQF